MNLIETLLLVFLSGCLLWLASFLSGRWGAAGWLVATPVGVLWLWKIYITIISSFKEARNSLYNERNRE